MRPSASKAYQKKSGVRASPLKEKREFVVFTERNTWEREVWKFFILRSGNRKSIERIRSLIRARPGYSLETSSLSLPAVLEAVERSPSGYLPRYNLVTKIRLPRRVATGDDPFYKGQAFECTPVGLAVWFNLYMRGLVADDRRLDLPGIRELEGEPR